MWSRLWFCWIGLLVSLPGLSSNVHAQTCTLERLCGTQCCAQGQVCNGGSCVALGASCQDSSTCPQTSFCSPTHKRCLPRITIPGQCTYRPPIGKFAPTLLWQWSGSSILPTYKQVMMTPVVMALQDTNGNQKLDVKDIPSVIFISHVTGGSYSEEGVVRALRGDNGKELFTVTDSRYRVNGLGAVAVGDIDNDGKPEIVAPRFAGRNVWNSGIYAFSNTGQFKWVSHDQNNNVVPLAIGWGGAALADLDGDGKVEVVVGNAVVRGSDGLVLCQGTKGKGSQDQRRPVSVVVDLDGDGKQEIVTGSSAYRHNCSLMWHNNEADGYTAVADLNLDGKPEVVVVSAGALRVQDGLSGKVLLRASIPGGGGGPPTIADFNGDKKPDIALAGRSYYVVFATDFAKSQLNLLWQFVTQDYSSAQTGSSVFDFEGDNKAEAVYNDERFMRVFNGATGKVLYSEPNYSATSLEYPVIVDVNNDGRAEIVMSSNHGNMANIRVFRDKLDNWVDTRNVWNQHAYNVTNICTGDAFCPPGNHFGQIPAKPLANWKTPGLNNFRQNVQGKGLFEAADLVLRDLQTTWVGCTQQIKAGVWVWNQGAKQIPAAIPVTFYQGSSSGAKTKLLTVTTTQPLEPGEGEWLTVTLTISASGPQQLTAAVDDDGTGSSTRNECQEQNNTISRTIAKAGVPEVCDGVDNNCDGTIDEGLSRSCQTICGTGQETCQQGKWVNCSATKPRSETCNDNDDDCDGQIDEDWGDKGKTCAVGIGACQRQGKWVCHSNGQGLRCDAQPGQPGPEICDGLDNDCNGQVDEKWPNKGKACEVGVGSCKNQGTWICKADKSDVACSVPPKAPQSEICDGQDNDCNGQIDDGLVRECQSSCGTGSQRCQLGQWAECSAPQPKAEICNDADDDCNGQVDENLSRVCSTACGKGKETCVRGKWVFCDAPKPVDEICDGKDNDCDGQTDEDLKPRRCVGDCGEGTATCKQGKWSGCSGPAPEPETCDGIDNDCNGKIDDNVTRSCESRCGSGVETCRNGKWGACNAPQPQPEVCNGKDDNCDGRADDEAPCPSGTLCEQGNCRPRCRNGECPGGMKCVQGTCHGNENGCQGVKCPAQKKCVAGRCVDPCELIRCPQDTVCYVGKCIPKGQEIPASEVNDTEPPATETLSEVTPTERPVTGESSPSDAGHGTKEDGHVDRSNGSKPSQADQGDNRYAPGCGCQGQPSEPWSGLLVLGLLVLWLRKRKDCLHQK